MNITRLNSFITQHLKKIEMLGVLMRIFSFSLVSWFGADSPFLFVWIFNTIDAIIMIAVKPRPSGRGCKAVTRKPPQGACLVSLTELGLERLFAKKED